MSSPLQTLLALALVVLATTYLVRRWWAHRRDHSCGCPPDKFKQRLPRRPRP